MLPELSTIAKEIGNASLMQAVAIFIALFTLSTKIRNAWKKGHAARIQAEEKFFSGRDKTDALLQLAYQQSFGSHATVPEIKALLDHPTDAVGVARARAKAGPHVLWTGTWFVMRSKVSNGWRLFLYAAWVLIPGVVGVATLTAAVPALFYAKYLIGSLLLAETAVLFAACFLNFRDFDNYAAARRLTRSKP